MPTWFRSLVVSIRYVQRIYLTTDRTQVTLTSVKLEYFMDTDILTIVPCTFPADPQLGVSSDAQEQKCNWQHYATNGDELPSTIWWIYKIGLNSWRGRSDRNFC